MSIEALEDEITTLSGHLNAANHRLLVLIEEFDRRNGWVGWGLRSCAHWLTWKWGIGIVAAREKVRVARALVKLPAVSEAMRVGRLSYSKVRAITRVAQPCDDSLWVQIADNATATHVETLARQQRKVCEAEQREQAVVQQERRSLSYFWDHDGCLVVEGRLPPEQGALLVKALEAADAGAVRGRSRGSAEGQAAVVAARVRRRLGGAVRGRRERQDPRRGSQDAGDSTGRAAGARRAR